MADIDCLVLGAGQEVGKSCVVVRIGNSNKRIMFDCGMHMAYQDHRRYPDFSSLFQPGEPPISCVIITHCHLDHVGALPYFTEVCGYKGPIYMTYPTKALAPLMLEDYRKVMVERRGEEEQFTAQQILDCMHRVIAVDLRQSVHVEQDLEICAYYAGHVLGAAMFYAKSGNSSVLYTGDYNMTPDRHLGAAQVERLEPDLLITESTYATTVRDSKLTRERDFVKAVHNCISGGGKVLIPVFALGRAQELCLILEDYWEQTNTEVPIYFSSGLTLQANMYFKMLIGWTNQKLKHSCPGQNPFDFKHVCDFDRAKVNAPGPCVLFATPGMLSGGFSLEVFKQWAPSENNMVALPGYCVAGTVGHKLMAGKPTMIHLDNNVHIDVRCQIHQVTFSAHTDSKGIMDLIKFVSPRHVVLVHGEKPKMAILKKRVQSDLGIPCYDPANNQVVQIASTPSIKVDLTRTFSKKSLGFISESLYNMAKDPIDDQSEAHISPLTQYLGLPLASTERRKISTPAIDGVLLMERGKRAKIMCETELLPALDVNEHIIQHCYCFPSLNVESTDHVDGFAVNLHRLYLKLNEELKSYDIKELEGSIQVKSLCIAACSAICCPHRLEEADGSRNATFFCCCWKIVDGELARHVISVMRSLVFYK